MSNFKLIKNDEEIRVSSERRIRLKKFHLPPVADLDITSDTPVAKFTASVSNIVISRPLRKYLEGDIRFYGGRICHPSAGMYGDLVYSIRDPRNGKTESTSLPGVKVASYSYNNDMVVTHLLMSDFYSEIRKKSSIDIFPRRDTPEYLFRELETIVFRTADGYAK